MMEMLILKVHFHVLFLQCLFEIMFSSVFEATSIFSSLGERLLLIGDVLIFSIVNARKLEFTSQRFQVR